MTSVSELVMGLTKVIASTVTFSLLIGCGDSRSPAKSEGVTELPGFNIWTPSGVVVRKNSHPAAGEYELRPWTTFQNSLPKEIAKLLPPPGPVVKVQWRIGALSPAELQEERRLMLEMLSGLLKAKGKITELSDGAWIATYDQGQSGMAIGYFRCEPWLTINATVGSAGNAARPDAIVRKMFGSLECRLESSEPPTLRAELILPDGYGAAVADEPTYVSLSGRVVVTSITNGDIARDQSLLQRVLRELLAAALNASPDAAGKTIVLQRDDGARSTLSEFTGDLGEAGERVHIGTLYCRDLSVTVLAMIFGNDDPNVLPANLISNLYCPGKFGEQYRERSVSEVFSGACESGNAGACSDLADLIDEGTADTRRGSSADFALRACKLGMKERCSEKSETSAR